MKGFIIFEDFKNFINCKEILDGYYTCLISECPNGTFSGIINRVTGATYSKDDTYDFETGALIALMKMCGLEKSAKAYAEIFDDTAYGDALIERDKLKEEIKRLKEKSAELLGENGRLKYIKSCNESAIESLENTRDLLINKNNELIEENEKLKSDKDKSWKNYQRSIQKKQDRINELNNIEEEYIKLREDYDSLFEEKEKLQHDYNLCLNSENALKYTVDSLNKSVAKLNKAIEGYKNDLYNTAKRCKELEEENKKLKDEVGLKNDAINEWKQTLRERTEKIGDLVCENYKLKTDCEKLQHGYIDNDMMFCGGRQNGKQFTFLVDLFKKIDQKKVDAAYKEAYNTTLPVWQKEVLNQMYGVYKESKEKPELPRTLDINGTVYRKSIQIKDFGEQINKLTVDSLIEQSRAFTKKCVDEWLNKPLTKREEMWGKILRDYKIGEGISIKVEKAFINDFLSEAEENGLVWANGGEKPTEWDRWESWRRHDYIVFSLFSVVNPKELTWNTTLKENTINYLPPMRWDLFEKGCLAVKVNYNNYKEFYEVCEKELGKRPVTAFMDDFTVSICKKDGNFEIFTVEDQKKTGRKIVDWEDVRENKTTTEDPYDTWKW